MVGQEDEQERKPEGGTRSSFSGSASEVVQARDVSGGVHFYASPPQGVRPVLRQLPADTALFTGRSGELKQLLALAQHAKSGTSPGTVVISAIDGMGGVGKTALAIHASHRLAHLFPDGQLFLDLHGFTQGNAPRNPGDALAALLGSLGVPPEQIPADLEARAAFYRDRLAGTRTLVVLDNAANEDQVRPLLPAADTCLVLVTSRTRLKALDDAAPLPLDVLSLEEAVTLLRKAALLDADAADQPLLQRGAELCGRLPLALLIAGALLRIGGKAWNLPLLVDRLAARRPGDELAGYTDETRSLTAVFDLSYRHLPEDRQLLFRRLGLLPGPEIDAYAAAALLDTNLERAKRQLQLLADHSLLTGASPGRYRIHDLLRAYARTLATTLDPKPKRDAALSQLLHYYAHTAQSASLSIARYPRPAPDSPTPAHAPALSDPEAARTWLRTEYLNLDAAFAQADANALHPHVLALAAGLAEILYVDGPWTRAIDVHQTTAETAKQQGHPAACATALTDLGHVRLQTGDYPEASDAHTRALEIYRTISHRLGEANALNYLGRVRLQTGDYPEASDAHTQALKIYRAIGNRLGEANALNYLGRVLYFVGDYPGASDAHTRALEIYRAISHRLGEANALGDLGLVRLQTRDYPEAGDAQTRALEIYRAIGHRSGEAWALNHYAATLAAMGERALALALYQQALSMNRELNKPDEEAISLEGIGEHHIAAGDVRQGISHLHQALAIYQRLGMRPDIDRVTARLTDPRARPQAAP